MWVLGVGRAAGGSAGSVVWGHWLAGAGGLRKRAVRCGALWRQGFGASHEPHAVLPPAPFPHITVPPCTAPVPQAPPWTTASSPTLWPPAPSPPHWWATAAPGLRRHHHGGEARRWACLWCLCGCSAAALSVGGGGPVSAYCSCSLVSARASLHRRVGCNLVWLLGLGAVERWARGRLLHGRQLGAAAASLHGRPAGQPAAPCLTHPSTRLPHPPPLQGTSMATPVTAGSALLLRQYFADGFYPSGGL